MCDYVLMYVRIYVYMCMYACIYEYICKFIYVCACILNDSLRQVAFMPTFITKLCLKLV